MALGLEEAWMLSVWNNPSLLPIINTEISSDTFLTTILWTSETASEREGETDKASATSPPAFLQQLLQRSVVIKTHLLFLFFLWRLQCCRVGIDRRLCIRFKLHFRHLKKRSNKNYSTLESNFSNQILKCQDDNVRQRKRVLGDHAL